MAIKEEKINAPGWVEDNRRWLAGILTVILLALGWLLLLGPQFKVLRESGILQYLTLKNNLSESQAYLADLQLMQIEYDKLDWRDLRKLDLVVPEAQDFSVLFWQLEQITLSNNLKLLGVSILAAEETEKKNMESIESLEELPDYLEKVTLTLNIEGGKSYQDFKNLISALEENAQILNIKSLVYLNGDNSYSLTLDTYYLKP